MKLQSMAKTGLTVLALAACFAAQAGNNGITASIATEKKNLGPHDDVVVHVTLTNTSSSPQFVLKWYTPFNEIEESLFEIKRDGVAVPYQGAHYKRPAPTADDYYLLKPGQSYKVKVELSALYDMSVTGDYSIRYNTHSMNLFAANLDTKGVVSTEKEMGHINSDGVQLWIDGSLPRGSQPKVAVAPTSGGSSQGLTFNKCTASQQSDITTALSTALGYAGNALNYMTAGTAGPRYVKWFGVNDATRFANIKAHYTAIKDAFATKPVNVDCGCKKTYYAYVYPTQPYTIYVCKAFWTAPMTGTDSKGGTLVHEMSHFNVTASTDDWVYGQTGAASLAISDPAKATDNADSHEYFGENTPALQ